MRNWPIVKTQLELFWSRNKKRSFIIFLVLLIITGTYYLYQQGILGLEQSGPTNPKSPTVPTNLTATAISSSQIDLSWGASTDDVGVAGYKAYRNNVYLHSVATTSISDTGLNPSTQYCYRVSAYDTEENGSAQSTQACAITLSPELELPPAPAPDPVPASVPAPPPIPEKPKKPLIPDTTDAETYNNRGIDYNNLGQHERAIEDYNEAIKLNPKYALAYYNRGTAYYKLEQYKRAIEDYNEAIKLNPKYATAYINRGTAYYKLEQYERAIEDYNEAIRLNPKYADAYYNCGIAYHNLGQYDDAIGMFNKVLKIDGDNKKALEGIERAKKAKSLIP